MTSELPAKIKTDSNLDPFDEATKGSITDRLKYLAKDRGGRVLEKVWGMSASTINGYILRGSIPSLDKASLIATAEGISLEWLAYGIETSQSGTTAALDAISISKCGITASAGGGTFVNTEEDSIVSVSRDWLRQNRLNHAELRIIEARGDSMYPTIADGDDLFLKIAKFHNREKPLDGVFVINLSGLIKVKRLQYDIIKDGYRIISDNSEYSEEFIHRYEIDDQLNVIGEVALVVGKPKSPQD
ncbi:LexA family transcriptional regulator [Shewanella halifaxensis]|uniref:LexA family transcriptional regulator n=1 Tax=Shewanella halifaxensis TaxID=271098 RepID=UPI000D59AB5B|nr:S24 family peptidase [Shewanella halifaxensis]